MMKILVVLCALFLPFLSLGKVLPDFKETVLCEKSLKEKIKSEFKQDDIVWTREADYNYDTRTYRASKTVGEWYEVHGSPSAAPTLSYISKDKNIEYTWTEKDCVMKESIGGKFVFFEPNKKDEVFSDKDLEKILKDKPKGFIYVWSPRMVYSVFEMKRYQEIAKELELDFIPVLDPNVPTKEALAALKAAVPKSPKLRKMASVDIPVKRMDSVELYMRNGTLHFPTLFIFKNGKIHERRIVGILNTNDVKSSINTWFQELN